jgi:hypothetical protein
VHHGLEGLLLLAEVLGALGIVPDLRVLDEADDLVQPALLRVEVKDTSAVRRTGGPGLRDARRWR